MTCRIWALEKKGTFFKGGRYLTLGGMHENIGSGEKNNSANVVALDGLSSAVLGRLLVVVRREGTRVLE